MPKPAPVQSRPAPLDFLKKYAALLIALLVFIYSATQAFDPPRLNWGDYNSDYNILTSGENFARVGFVNLRFTPVVLSPHYQPGGAPPEFYTHYPPLPDLANGLWRSLGFTALYQFRLIALLFSFAALLFFHPLVKHYWSKPVADVATVFWVCTPLWLQHADYLHHYPYCWFFGLGTLYWLLRYFQSDKKRFIALSAGFLFFTYLSSYDYWFFVPLLVAIMAWRHVGSIKSRRYWAIVGLISLGAFSALFVKLALSAWALGSWGAVFHDLVFQFHERATDKVNQIGFRAGALTTITLRSYRTFTALFGPALLFAILVPLLGKVFRKHNVDVSLYRNNPAVLFLLGLPFVFCFMELCVGQYYPILQFQPAFTISCAVFLVWLMGFNKQITRLAAGACVALMAFHVVLEMTTLKKAFMSDAAIASLRKDIEAAPVDARTKISANHNFDGLYRYYFSRHIDPIIFEAPDTYKFFIRGRKEPGLFIEHKKLDAQLFDKTLYVIFARAGRWDWFGDPVKYRENIAFTINGLNKLLMDEVAKVATKISDHEEYAVWLIPPTEPLPTPTRYKQ